MFAASYDSAPGKTVGLRPALFASGQNLGGAKWPQREVAGSSSLEELGPGQSQKTRTSDHKKQQGPQGAARRLGLMRDESSTRGRGPLARGIVTGCLRRKLGRCQGARQPSRQRAIQPGNSNPF